MHNFFCHSAEMQGKELLIALMERAKENANSLADTLNDRALQSAIQRFITGATKSPRWETFRPVADYYGIPLAALYEPEETIKAAISKGILPPPKDAEVHVITPVETSTVEVLRFAEAVARLGTTQRKYLSLLYQDLISEPGRARELAQEIARLLSEPPGKASRPPSTGSRPVGK